ncbi:hypothetical protein [Serratia odorifera]|uniref:hypothetical protein n=1 Tax=Serratia odorifera TaxID=618 RepID=UPI0018E743E1|nr:hypothetical protein [Serratia odorifera]MBJ2066166.1 hypothetical protein [Serratia odorifera]
MTNADNQEHKTHEEHKQIRMEDIQPGEYPTLDNVSAKQISNSQHLAAKQALMNTLINTIWHVKSLRVIFPAPWGELPCSCVFGVDTPLLAAG